MAAKRVQIKLRIQRWPVAGHFTIARGSRTEAVTVEVRAEFDGSVGRAECVPYARYGETPESVMAAITSAAQELSCPDIQHLQGLLPPGAARNGLDCALWDLQAKLRQQPVYALLDLPKPKPVITAYTISLDTPERMGEAAAQNAKRPLLKVKLSGENTLACIEAVHKNAPAAQLILDANEAWLPADYDQISPKLTELGVALIEQPFAAKSDMFLTALPRPIPVCADESCHTGQDVQSLCSRYDAVNIKLDKTGGLTEAVQLLQSAKNSGLKVMVGCMLGSSLAMAPALLLASSADFVDLDGPLLLQKDYPEGLEYDTKGWVHPPSHTLWGSGRS